MMTPLKSKKMAWIIFGTNVAEYPVLLSRLTHWSETSISSLLVDPAHEVKAPPRIPVIHVDYDVQNS